MAFSAEEMAERPRRRSNARHGHSRHGARSRTYVTWMAMMQRCNDAHSKQYQNYGARGVMVCVRWRVFENFLADMGERPEGRTLDRYPNHAGNYEPGNCRWATPTEQANNTRANLRLEYKGQAYSAAELARIAKVPISTIWNRLKRKWSVEETVSGIRARGPNPRIGKPAPPTSIMRGSKHGQSVLTEEGVLEIRRVGGTPVANRALAEKFGVQERNIRKVLARKLWSHI